MTSTDETLYRENQWIWDGEYRFLDGQSLSHNKVGFTSFPRSGNSFLRRYVEQLTGVTTGSAISLHTSTSLQINGLKGEGVINDTVWVAKSHHPFNIKRADLLPVNKTFVCVRNPLDVFPSFASLCNTLSHGNKTEYEFDKDYPEYWNWFVRRQAEQQRRFFDILLRHCNEENRCPLYIVRYEDLVSAPKETLMGLMSFLLEVKDLKGTNIERRIDEVCSKGKSAATTYRLKDTTGQFDMHRAKYSPELLQYVQETLSDQLYYFGYANVEDNATGFFQFEEHAPANLAKFNKFRSDSQASLDKVTSQGHQPQIYVHNKEEVFDIFSEDDLTRLLDPAFDHARKSIQKARQGGQA